MIYLFYIINQKEQIVLFCKLLYKSVKTNKTKGK